MRMAWGWRLRIPSGIRWRRALFGGTETKVQATGFSFILFLLLVANLPLAMAELREPDLPESEDAVPRA